MVRFIFLWKSTPTDTEGFQQHYRDVHIPLGKELPGLRRYTLSKNMTPMRGGDPCYQIAELDFDDMATLQDAFKSLQGRATAEDATLLAATYGLEAQSMVFELEEL